MPVVSLISGAYCQAEEVCHALTQRLGYPVIDDQALAALAGQRFKTGADRYLRVLTGKASVFGRFTHDREKSLAQLKELLAELIQKDEIILQGLAGLLIPRSVSHVLRVCLIAEMGHRVRALAQAEGVAEKEALARLHRSDEAAGTLSSELYGRGPWEADLYDILIPMAKETPDQAVGLIVAATRRLLLQPTAESCRAAADFALAARVESHLADKGHFVEVAAQDGAATLTVNKHVLMFAKLEAELTRLASGLAGVKAVTVKVGPGFHQADTYRHVDLELPSKILLVDDEAEFVETLSERLLARDLGSVVVYDGRQALEMVAQEEPEVMVLDLKMPGLHGLEVLRRIKAEHPRVEVIILTGHGSEADRRTALELGAFAYLQKPVEIEVLGQTLKEAYRAAKEKADGGAA